MRRGLPWEPSPVTRPDTLVYSPSKLSDHEALAHDAELQDAFDQEAELQDALDQEAELHDAFDHDALDHEVEFHDAFDAA